MSVARRLTLSLSFLLVTGAPAFALEAADLIGKWGVAAYFDDKDAAREIAAAHSACSAPYPIARGPSGGVMMHLPDHTKTSELQVKTSLGKTYVGPAGDSASMLDREVLNYDGRVLVLNWLDPSVANRYGKMVFARCGR